MPDAQLGNPLGVRQRPSEALPEESHTVEHILMPDAQLGNPVGVRQRPGEARLAAHWDNLIAGATFVIKIKFYLYIYSAISVGDP
jgi:hypothetical protein